MTTDEALRILLIIAVIVVIIVVGFAIADRIDNDPNFIRLMRVRS